jgi:hypothetical protein
MLHQTIFPLVLPLTAQPSARLEADDTLPPSFIGLAALANLLPNPLILAGAGFGPPVVPSMPRGLPPIGIGAGFGPPVVPTFPNGPDIFGRLVGIGLTPGAGFGPPVVTPGLVPGLVGAAGIGFVGALPGAYLII